MAIHKNKTFEKARVELDGNKFVNCTFKNCLFIFRGGQLPKFHTVTFVGDCPFQFMDSAENTVHMLKVMHANGFSKTVEWLFEDIRKHQPDDDWTDTIE